MTKYKCPCCGYYTFVSKPVGDYNICPVCYWEDDPYQAMDPDEDGMANGVSLNQAKENFKKFGAVTEGLVEFARPPEEDELSGSDG